MITCLENERKLFEDSKYLLLSEQRAKFEVCCGLFRPPSSKSRQQRWLRGNARRVLEELRSVIGDEVFVLIAIAVPVKRLGTLKLKDEIAALRRWWENAINPAKLKEVAKELCKVVGTFSSLRAAARYLT